MQKTIDARYFVKWDIGLMIPTQSHLVSMLRTCDRMKITKAPGEIMFYLPQFERLWVSPNCHVLRTRKSDLQYQGNILWECCGILLEKRSQLLIRLGNYNNRIPDMLSISNAVRLFQLFKTNIFSIFGLGPSLYLL